MRSVVSGVILTLALSAEGTAQQARGPAFDCAKTQGEVEQLVCTDKALAALDRKLNAVFKASLAKAPEDRLQVLRAEQRGWAKGRDDCGKAQPGAPTSITATWQVTGVRACVEASYKVRIAELQAAFRLVPARGPFSFTCPGSPASEVVATFFETDPQTVVLERGPETVTAYQVASGSGARYEGRNVEFWNKGDEARVTWLDVVLSCATRPPPR